MEPDGYWVIVALKMGNIIVYMNMYDSFTKNSANCRIDSLDAFDTKFRTSTKRCYIVTSGVGSWHSVRSVVEG